MPGHKTPGLGKPGIGVPVPGGEGQNSAKISQPTIRRRVSRKVHDYSKETLNNSILEFSAYGCSCASLRPPHWGVLPGKKQKTWFSLFFIFDG